MQVGRLPSADTGAGAQLGAETLWSLFRDRLRAFVVRRVPHAADADDIVQWVFLQLHRSLGEIRSGERIHAWLYSTARRAVADYYRSRHRRREVPVGDVFDLDALPPGRDAVRGDDDGEPQAVAECLAPMVEMLPASYREAIVLTELQGLRLADAAQRTGVSLSGMKSRVQRARQKLRAMLLECCHLELDGRGVPTGCVRRDAGLSCCRGSISERS